MADHRFKLGQNVRLTRSFPDRTGAGSYEIIRLLPEGVDGEPSYRIRGADKVERAVTEGQLVRPNTD